MKYLLALLVSAAVVTAQADKKLNPRPAKPDVEVTEKIERPEKDVFGIWLDDEGFMKPGPKILNWIDSDRDKVDDRLQTGPGKPQGKRRPQVAKPEPRPEPKPKPEVREFPKHWGEPPTRQTRDLVQLPGKFGKGSSTLKDWITANIKKDKENPKVVKPPKPKKPHQPKEGTKEGSDKKPKLEKPKRPARPEVSSDLKDKLDSYKEEKEALNKDLRAAIDDIKKKFKGHPVSRAGIKKIIEQFNKENKDRIDAQKALGKEIKEGFKANRPERPVKPEISDEVKVLHGQINEVTKKLTENKKALMNKLQEAKKQDVVGKSDHIHKEIIDSFREEQASLMNELKGIQKQVREQLDHNRSAEVFNQQVQKKRPPRRPDAKTEDRRPADR